ncbi:hypothetical protein [Streptomyces sp. NPDC058045]|uniref:hypothetical protein n=1 Tax=Streptomyces sp. NPDC058045 TaxID=3346311 RepID=UPI0036EFD30F
MSAARRSLLTATAAGTVLCALWFIPSANAVPTAEERPRTAAAEDPVGAPEGRLADTGGVDTTPYLVGGTVFLGVGAGFVAYSMRGRTVAAE